MAKKKQRQRGQRRQPRQARQARPATQPRSAERGRQREPIDRREQQQAVEFNGFNGTPGSALGPDNESAIDEASAESFPASDPPAWSRNGI